MHASHWLDEGEQSLARDAQHDMRGQYQKVHGKVRKRALARCVQKKSPQRGQLKTEGSGAEEGKERRKKSAAMRAGFLLSQMQLISPNPSLTLLRYKQKLRVGWRMRTGSTRNVYVLLRMYVTLKESEVCALFENVYIYNGYVSCACATSSCFLKGMNAVCFFGAPHTHPVEGTRCPRCPTIHATHIQHCKTLSVQSCVHVTRATLRMLALPRWTARDQLHTL